MRPPGACGKEEEGAADALHSEEESQAHGPMVAVVRCSAGLALLGPIDEKFVSVVDVHEPLASGQRDKCFISKGYVRLFRLSCPPNTRRHRAGTIAACMSGGWHVAAFGRQVSSVLARPHSTGRCLVLQACARP
jgi:hypothetical protein